MPPFTRQFSFDGKPIFLVGEKGSGLTGQQAVQDFYKLRQKCLDSQTLFEDPEFPPTDRSLFFSHKPKVQYQWLRPKEISKDPQFFVDSFSRFDVQQGELGNCWLIAAIASLTQDRTIFYQVVCEDNGFQNYAGIFHFRFWQYGKWVDIVIDDRLPTHNGQLEFMFSSNRNEFWSALLEKAYAKLYGSYEALKGGSACEALEDFTGGITEIFLLNEAPSNFFSILEKSFARKSMMACSIDTDSHPVESETPQGLFRGHSYSITNVSSVDIEMPNKSGKIELLRLRNPWGNDAVEWKGAFSDNSPCWSFIADKDKENIGLTFSNDGEFWISFPDFMKYFNRIEVCNLSPDPLSDDLQDNEKRKEWKLIEFEGEWVNGISAGGSRNHIETFDRNPQYLMTIEGSADDRECAVVVALMQKNRRSRRRQTVKYLDIGFAIYKVTENELAQKPLKRFFFESNYTTAKCPAFLNVREVCTRFYLPPGHYLIIPSTFEPNAEGEFFIRVFLESCNSFEENDQIADFGSVDSNLTSKFSKNVPSTSIKLTLTKLFYDAAGAEQEIGWMKVKHILDGLMRDDLKMKPLHAQTNGDGARRVNNRRNVIASTRSFFSRLFFRLSKFCNAEVYDQIDDNDENTRPLIKGSQNGNKVQGFSREACRSMVAMLDVDHSGKLGFEEFKTLYYEVNKWKTVFKQYDDDHTNTLDAYELRNALASCGYQLNTAILNSLFYRYGSPDQTIAFEDFIMCAVKVKTMIEHFKEKDFSNNNRASFTLNEWITKSLYS